VIPDQPGGCWDLFLNNLKLNFSTFVQYKATTEKEFWFKPEQELEPVQEWVDAYECEVGEAQFLDTVENADLDTIVRTVDPTITENLHRDIIWINKKTGEMFTCIDDSMDTNIWRGTSPGKLIRPIPSADKIDFFGDNSCLGFYKLGDNALSETGRYHGEDTGIEYKPVFDGFVASSVKHNGTIKIKTDFNKDTEIVTISGWIKWTGMDSTMPFGWKYYDLYCSNGYLGFNTSGGDLYGFNFKEYKNKWVYITVEFKKGTPGKIYLNSVLLDLAQIRGSFSSWNSEIYPTLTFFGWKSGRSYRKFGEIGRIRVFDRELTQSEVQDITSAEIELIRKLGGNV
jgi:hypothetical protein